MENPSRAPDLIDIGVNLAHDSFDHDRDAVIDRAAAAGVRRMVITGTSAAASRDALALAQRYPGRFYATAGVHPHHAGDYDGDTTPALRALAAEAPVRAIGECGLDHFRNYSTPAEQDAAFEAQLELAAGLGMPVFLHQRDAHRRFVEILRLWRDRLPAAVAHCFTGGADALDDCLDLDLHIGITGWICDERRGHHLRELVGRIPPQRLMIETDAPYLLPRDLSPRPRTRRNEPMHLAHILEVVAACAGRPAPQVARETTATAERFFGLAA